MEARKGDWTTHHGNGCPLPKGTIIDVRHFNGEVTPAVSVGAFTVDLDGTPISRDRGRWSGWHFSDGGPMAPKFKAYRVVQFVRHAGMDSLRALLPTIENAALIQDARDHIAHLDGIIPTVTGLQLEMAMIVRAVRQNELDGYLAQRAGGM